MVLESLDIQVPYLRLLTLLDVAPWGTPHRNIRQLEENFASIHVIHKQGALPDLFQVIESGFPATVFVWTGDLPYWDIETWHAVVIIGYDEQYFYLNDPAFNEVPFAVLHGDLDLAWIAYDSYFAVIEKVSNET